MAFFDLPLDELRAYKPAREEPADFDAFWQRTLADAVAHPLDARFTPVDYELETLDTFDVTFSGYGGQPVKGWLILPRQRAGKLPCVVEFIGYGGGRGYPVEWLHWASSGFAHLVMDTRGQGSAWRKGDTPDLYVDGANPSYPGFMTQGILSPETYYYRRVFTDGVRAVEAARSHPDVDGQRIALQGGSQGGGITLAVTALAEGIAASLPDVPFLCNFRRAVTLVNSYPYQEIAQFCKVQRDVEAQVFATLAYFDGMAFAARATAPALFSTSLMDDICPPSTVFAAYNHYAGPKDISVYTFNGHEGGEVTQRMKQVKFLKQVLG